jgi:hypothetical protein
MYRLAASDDVPSARAENGSGEVVKSSAKCVLLSLNELRHGGVAFSFSNNGFYSGFGVDKDRFISCRLDCGGTGFFKGHVAQV